MENQVKIIRICMAFFILGIIAGCKNTEEKKDFVSYENKEYGISFLYPSAFQKTQEEPTRFALLDKDKNAIILIIEDNPSTLDILELGRDEAYKDMGQGVAEKKEIDKHVKIMQINQISWYNYAIDFPNEEVKSIISGTLCNNKQVSIVLATKNNAYEKNQQYYEAILQSFKC